MSQLGWGVRSEDPLPTVSMTNVSSLTVFGIKAKRRVPARSPRTLCGEMYHCPPRRFMAENAINAKKRQLEWQ